MKERRQSQFTLHIGDCVEQMRKYPDNYFDSVVTDPPYGIEFMGREWDTAASVAFKPATWREALRVLKPGGHLLAFGGTRMYHRLVCAVEDAGFEMRDMIAWIYGSGFPKSLDASKALDAHHGIEREITREATAELRSGEVIGFDQRASTERERRDVPITDDAKKWDGWGTALKPAIEPICVGRKPLAKCSVYVRHNIERELRARGVEGTIEWNSSAANAEHRPATGRSASLADASETVPCVNGNERSSEPSAEHGTNNIRGEPESTDDSMIRNSVPRSCKHTEESVRVVGSGRRRSSHSITSMEEAPNIAVQPTERSMQKSDDKASPRPIESFVGIATGLTGSQALVHIKRTSDGLFLWPEGVPSVLPGSSLTVAQNLLEHGTGAVNIKACRIRVAADDANHRVPSLGNAGANSIFGVGGHDGNLQSEGRWPANVIHDGSEEVVSGFPDLGIAGQHVGRNRDGAVHNEIYGARRVQAVDAGYEDQGSAARFFYAAKVSQEDRKGRWPANVIHDGSPEVLADFPDAPGQIAPIAYGSERRKTAGIYGEMSRGHRPGGFGNVGADKGSPIPNGPMYEDQGSAARFYYAAKASQEDREQGLDSHPLIRRTDGRSSEHEVPNLRTSARRNFHPTVKPIDLMRYLVRLVTPPGGVVLDPFMGSGSTGKACMLEGFRFVGMDLTADYEPIARARILWAKEEKYRRDPFGFGSV